MPFGYKLVKDKDVLDLLNDSNTTQKFDDDLYDSDFLAAIGIKKGSGDSQIGTIINKLRLETQSRKDRYKEYDRAAKDPVIGQAIEMMADDATQFDVDRSKTVWIESPDKKYEEAINGIIADYIEPFIDTVASRIVSRGEFIFKVNSDNGKKRGNFKDVILLPYKHVEKIHHLILDDQTHYFYEVDDLTTVKDKTNISKELLESNKFLHFINYSIENSDEIQVKVENGKKAEVKDVFVLQGESIITDKVLETHRILTSLENAIVQMRLAKSKIIRFINVDVTRLSDNKKAQNLVNYVHSALAENEAIGGDTYTTSSIQAEPVTVTIPVRNGVGAIHVEEFATGVDIKDIADIDYFMSKQFAGLRTPRAYFNFDEALPGVGASGASLTKTDIRYARAVKKVQRVIVNAIDDLVIIFNEANGLAEKAPEYTTKIVKVSTAEDADRGMDIEQRLSSVMGVMQGIMNTDGSGGYNQDALNAYIKYFTLVIPMKEVVEWLTQLQKKIGIVSKPVGLKVGGIIKPIEKTEEQTKEKQE